MGFIDRMKDFVMPDDTDGDDEDVYVEEEAVEVKPKPSKKTVPDQTQQSRYEKKTQSNLGNLSDNTKMVLYEPRSFSESQEAGLRLKEGRAIVVNLHKLDRENAQHTIDFLMGVVFALDGDIQQIGRNVILCNPATIGVSGSINLGGPDEEIEEEVDIYAS